MSNEVEESYPPPRPGDASLEAEDLQNATLLDSEVESNAYYSGQSHEKALETWASECLCLNCHCQKVCQVATTVEASLISVTRCLSFVPLAKRG